MDPTARIRSLAEACLCVMVTPCERCGAGPMRAADGPIAFDPAGAVLRVPVACDVCGRETTLAFRADRTTLPEPLPDRLPDASFLPADEPGWQISGGEDEPSQVIDVPGWVTLFTMLSEAAREATHRRDAGATPDRRDAGATPDRRDAGATPGRPDAGAKPRRLETGATTAGHGGPALQQAMRRLNLLAGCCLDEALKFFDADNDVPPEDAFFSDASRQQFRDRPERFTRQRIIDLRSQLPVSRATAPARPDQREPATEKKGWWPPWRR